MPKVNLTATYGYRDPVTGERTYYGPGMGIEVPQGLADTLGLTPLAEAEVQAQQEAQEEDTEQVPTGDELPDDFPGRRYLVQEGHTTLAAVRTLSIDDLIEIKGIGTRLAEQILERASATPAG
jgi:hypothetical protein